MKERNEGKKIEQKEKSADTGDAGNGNEHCKQYSADGSSGTENAGKCRATGTNTDK